MNGQVIRQQQVWDVLVRVLHWSLVTCVAANLLVLEEGEAPHRWAGYAACGVVLIRLVWGFVGSHHARFASFVRSPRAAWQHLQQVLQGRHQPEPGHNPAGALMMLSLLALVLSLGISGYLMGTDAFWGEEWLEEVHEALANTLQAAVLLHVLAAVVMSRIERVNLIHAMISGVKVWRGTAPKE